MARKRCTICQHEARAHAEILLARGDSFAATARKLGMSQDALERHWRRHCTEQMREAMKPGAKALAARAELAGQIAEEGVSTLDHLRAARALLWQMIVEERGASHSALATMAAAQYSKVCGLIAKITGEWAVNPLIANTSLHFHFTADPGFQRLMDDVAEALEAYPEAKAAVFARFAALEGDGRASAIDVSADVPALEQQPISTSCEERHADAAG
jgi:hypothetical protein